MEMPPLPEAFAVHELWGQDVYVYTAEQMRAFGESRARMAREEERAQQLLSIMEVAGRSLMPQPTIADAIRDAREEGRRAGLEEAAKLCEKLAEEGLW